MPSFGLIQHRLIIKRLAVVFALYTFCRVIFFLHNIHLLKNIATIDLVTAFFWGMRFDISAIIFLNLPLILLWLLPGYIQKSDSFKKITFVVFVIANIAFTSATLVDADLIHFTNRRMTLDFWSLGGDWLKQIPQLFSYYWKLTLMGFVCLGVVIKTFPFWEDHHRLFKTSFVASTLWNFVFVSFLIIGARGGLQFKPLIPGHANVYTNPLLNHMVLNTTFTFLMSLKKERIEPKKWFDSDQQALAKIQRPKDTNKVLLGKKNIVIILLESFSLEYTGKANGGVGYTPFLDFMAERSTYFPNFHANGRRSIEAIPSILCGLPSLLKEPFITSQFQTNSLTCLPEILASHGYSTHFFHGGDNGTMHFDSFAKKMGVQKYYGLNEYTPAGQDFDGSWGIYDEPFYLFMLKALDSAKQPFQSLFFSLSSHQPYSVPEKYNNKFPKGTLEIHESVGYADFSLRQFFIKAEKTKWYKNTIFIITADHTQKSDNPKYANNRGSFRVPLFIFDPSAQLKPQVNPKISQHADIMPTTLGLLGLGASEQYWGGNLFSTKDNGVMVNRTSTGLLVGKGGEYFEYSFAELEESKSENNTKGVTKEFARAYYQTYLNSLIYNKTPAVSQ